ncbi:hypothetical protein V2J09_009300 [Rumex salicifolius]
MEFPPWTQRISNILLDWIASDPLLSNLFFMLVPQFKIISWNVQGAGSRSFLNNLKNLIRLHDLTILVLLETRISGSQANKVCAQIGFDGLIRVEAVGFSGEEVIRTVYSQLITLVRRRLLEELWSRLLNFGATSDLPWLLLGEFNETKALDERTVDLGFSGRKYTWNRGTNPSTRTSTRLDRCLCNASWSTRFIEASIRHLTTNQSDHAPLLVDFNGFNQEVTSSRPFRFQEAWLMTMNSMPFGESLGHMGATNSSSLLLGDSP